MWGKSVLALNGKFSDENGLLSKWKRPLVHVSNRVHGYTLLGVRKREGGFKISGARGRKRETKRSLLSAVKAIVVTGLAAFTIRDAP